MLTPLPPALPRRCRERAVGALYYRDGVILRYTAARALRPVCRSAESEQRLGSPEARAREYGARSSCDTGRGGAARTRRRERLTS